MASVGLYQPPVWLAQATPGQLVPVTLVDATDLTTLETGVASPTIQISKNGAAFVTPSDGTWAEIGSGDYTVRLNGTDTIDTGWILLLVVKTGTSAETRVMIQVGMAPNELRALYLMMRKR